MTSPAHWPKLARLWSLLGPPLRPSPEDVAIVERAARDANARRALLLGVTPELATCAWPAGATLDAVDSSEAMIAHVWPAADVRVPSRAHRADWRALPFDGARFDLVAADGALTLPAYPEGARDVLREARRVLVPGGRLATRVFVQAPAREEARAVVDDLRAGRVGGFHAFKWRLAMALHESSDRGVRLADVWTAWRDLAPDGAALVESRGWGRDVLDTIDVYRDSPTVYVFPRVDEVVALARGLFDLEATHVPGYELGDRCPTLVLRAAS